MSRKKKYLPFATKAGNCGLDTLVTKVSTGNTSVSAYSNGSDRYYKNATIWSKRIHKNFRLQRYTQQRRNIQTLEKKKKRQLF